MPRLGRPIAVGRTAEVFGWGKNWVLKLFRPPWSTSESVDREAWIARAVHATGLPVSSVGDVVEIDGRLGLLYERVAGLSMLQLLRMRPWNFGRYARLLADLHARVHACRAPQLPSQRERVERKIRTTEGLAPADRETLLAGLGRVSDGEHLCHGDFHPGNIIMTSGGPVIIDWVDATRGVPLGDIARTSLLLHLGAGRGTTPQRWWAALVLGGFRRTYLTHSFERCPGGRAGFAAWEPLVAAARLSENVAGERERLFEIVRRHIS